MVNVATDKPKIQGNVRPEVAELFDELAEKSETKSKSSFLEEHLAASLGKTHIDLSPEEITALTEIASKNRRSVESQIAVIVADYLRANNDD